MYLYGDSAVAAPTATASSLFNTSLGISLLSHSVSIYFIIPDAFVNISVLGKLSREELSVKDRSKLQEIIMRVEEAQENLADTPHQV